MLLTNVLDTKSLNLYQKNNLSSELKYKIRRTKQQRNPKDLEFFSKTTEKLRNENDLLLPLESFFLEPTLCPRGVTGTDSRLLISRLIDCRVSSMNRVSISFTTNFGINFFICKALCTQNSEYRY